MTATSPLKSLRLNAFRGSCASFTLDFDTGKKLALIYGENGTGKTTICDAFEFLAAEKIGSLEDRGMGAGLAKYWPTAGKPANDLEVHLETHAGHCTGKIVDKKVSVAPAASKPRIELLRQQQILRLIAAQPAKRYEEIKRFIDIAEYEQSEDALQKLAKSLATQRSDAQKLEDESLASLVGFYDAAGKPAGLNPVTWAKQKLGEPQDGLDAKIAAISKIRTAFDTLKAFPDRLTNQNAAIATATDNLARADTILADAASSASEGAAEMLKVLEAGNDYLHAHPDIAACPLCESMENATGLADAIAAKLTNLSALRDATGQRNKCAGELTNTQSALERIKSEFAGARTAFTAAKDGHEWDEAVALPQTRPPSDINDLQQWIDDSTGAAETWPAIESAWREDAKFITALKTASERYDSNRDQRETLAALVPKVDQALKLCVEQRQAFTDKIISDIATNVGKLYDIVHPGEGLDAIALPLDPKKRASIELEAKFSGLDVPPQAYFSQSHLDTLGLCVFLALALRDRPEETILILDDVLGSVDEPHVERVIGMIYDVSAKFRHTIVTTHYRPWREKYRWGWLKPGQPCQFVELTGWAIDEGMRLISSMPEIDRLKALLAEAPIDPQAICSKAGVILEAVLDYLTQKYECAVPRKFGAAYTLGDLLPAIKGKLRDALTIEIRDGIIDPSAPPTQTVALKPILDELSRIAQARNAFGAHFKAISFEMLDTDAVGFAKQVVSLVEALTHPEHGWPSNASSGSYWRNNGDSRRLHPLKKPS